MINKSIEDNMLYQMRNMATSSGNVFITNKHIASAMGYKDTGGAITLGLKLLIAQGKIKRISKNHYKVIV